jgi:leader peptidase (prepilin peptidase)/N-methyltransferase
LLGWPKGLVAMMGSFIIGAVVGVFLIVSKIKGRKDTVPFVPFMIAAMVIAMLWGESLIGYVN